MSNLWLRVKIWFRVGLAAALFLYVLLFTFENAQEKVRFWYWFHRQPQTNLLVLVLCTFLAGVIGALVARALAGTVRQIQDLQRRNRSQRLDRDMADLRAKAAMLQTREASPPPPPRPIETLESRRQP